MVPGRFGGGGGGLGCVEGVPQPLLPGPFQGEVYPSLWSQVFSGGGRLGYSRP